ncbi:MAG: SDR family oxidoreductase [Bacteroidota bacterium]
MDLQIKGQRFLVTGATSGFGKAIAERLIAEGGNVVIVARGGERVQDFVKRFPEQVTGVVGDITQEATIREVVAALEDGPVHGVLVNAGGPPAKAFVETSPADWDAAYQSLLRWKVMLTQALLPRFEAQRYGRLLYIESSSVKQPIENLVLSNAFRLGMVGTVKTLSREVAQSGITANIIAPGYHDTPAMGHLFEKKSAVANITPEEARAAFEQEILLGKLGDPEALASLGVWLLSPLSAYMTGQTIAVDGGLVRGTL